MNENKKNKKIEKIYKHIQPISNIQHYPTPHYPTLQILLHSLRYATLPNPTPLFTILWYPTVPDHCFTVLQLLLPLFNSLWANVQAYPAIRYSCVCVYEGDGYIYVCVCV